jgi:XTP/dITP diphosphohydrolase
VSGGPLRLVIASANPHKVTEILEILDPVLAGRVEILPRPPEVGEIDETGENLLENALLKAHAISAATGLPAVADDTGLEVDALDGAPGVYSARYAGDGATDAENLTKLLTALEAEPVRTARFRTVAVVTFPDGRVLTTTGVTGGRIGEVPRGDGGFGYDPVFVPDGEIRTYAELGADEKNRMSHRGKAFRELAALLGAELGRSPGQ